MSKRPPRCDRRLTAEERRAIGRLIQRASSPAMGAALALALKNSRGWLYDERDFDPSDERSVIVSLIEWQRQPEGEAAWMAVHDRRPPPMLLGLELLPKSRWMRPMPRRRKP